ncbi:MAG TPA: hypothetical protein VE135_24670 [Pyrinomonadaceae bacterium]|nr:hypothetical protein [Pyrinomonadaceae bacterium]
MVTILITSAIVLSILVVAVYFWQKPTSQAEPPLLPVHREPRGLFSSEQLTPLQPPDGSDEERQKVEIIQRAEGGDKKTLQDAHTRGDQKLYAEALTLLTTAADTDPKLLSLISYVTRAELPVNKQLAERMLESWKKAPDRSGTAKTLHIVALSNDASLYNSAVEAAMQFWRARRLPEVSAQELTALFDGEFWLLSKQVRGSGAGFVLKRTLASARRELNVQAPVNQ